MTDEKKPRKAKAPTPPACQHCGEPGELVSAQEIFGHRERFSQARFWLCRPCRAYAPAKPNGRALGRPANAQLRDARLKLHERFDAIWRQAPPLYEINSEQERIIILSTAKRRTYAYLASLLSIDVKECQIEQFDLQRCRDAWVSLNGLTYAAVRRWTKENES